MIYKDMHPWITISLIVFFLFFCPITSLAAQSDDMELFAKAAVLLDGDSGRVLWGKEENLILPMASTTKIMTCILALENTDVSECAEVSDYATTMPKVRLNVKSGEKYVVEDLLHSLMLESHNDVAVVIAEHVAGSVENFAELMNKKADEIGCKNTCFITPNGLDAVYSDNSGSYMHSTTAVDLAKMMRYCVFQSPKRKEFLRITQTKQKTFTDVDGNRSFCCTNHNAFLQMMEGVLSGKTGFTGKAGYCYVCAFDKDGKSFVVALLACGWPNHKNYKWMDASKLLAYGMEQYEYKTFSPRIKLKKVGIENGYLKGQTPFQKVEITPGYDETYDKIRLLVKNGESVKIKVKYTTDLEAPVEKDTIIGSIYYILKNETGKNHLIGKVPIIIGRNVEKISLNHYFFYVLNKYFKVA